MGRSGKRAKKPVDGLAERALRGYTFIAGSLAVFYWRGLGIEHDRQSAKRDAGNHVAHSVTDEEGTRRIDSVVRDEEMNSFRETVRLSCAWTGEDEERVRVGFDRRALRR
jgi:hypothetical protein